MVIVFNHVLVSSFLFYRHPERFLINTDGCSNEASEEPRSASSNLTEQDTKLNSIVTETTDFRTLHVKVRDAIQNFASKSVTSVVYLIDVSTGNLYADKDNIICFPKSGIIWECFRSKKYRFSQNIDPNDPACPVLTLHQSNSRWKPKSVLCCPVNDMGEVIAVIVVSSSVAEEIDDLSLQPIADQIIGCYRNLCKGDGSSTSSERRESSSFPLAKSDKEAIMKLCGELYDQDASILQLKVIKYLEEQTNAECAFLLLVVPETQELFCQVIGHKVLDQEVRFPGQTSNFAKALETKEHMSLDDIPLDKRKGLEEFLDTSLQSLLCVPVASKHSDNLIALACVINKQDLESFTKVDVETIKTCFQYTATVLTSTLAFQNERKLKIQTQAMLQVARNLFTHLGEFTQLHGQGLNDFPDIPVGQTSVDVRGMSVGDILLNDNDKGLHTFSKSTRKDNYLQFNNSDRTQSQETQPSYLAMNPNDSNDTCIQILPENSFQVHLQYHDVACDTNDDKFEMLARSVQTVFGNSNSCADVENIEPPLQGTVSPYNVSVTHNTMASPYPTAPSEDPNVPYSLVSEDDYNDANPSLPDDQSSTTLKSTTTLPKASRSATDNLETFGDVPELNSDSAIRPVCNDTCIQTLSEKLDRFQVHPQYRDVACDTNDYKLEMLARSVQTVFGNSISCADVENTEPPLHGTVSPYNVPVTHNTMASPYFTAPSEDPNVPYSLVSEDDYNYANLSLPDDQSNTTLKSTTTLPKASRSATDNVETYGDVPELNSDSAIRPVCNDTCIQTLSEKLDRFQVHPQYRDVACDTNDDKFEMLARSVQTVFGNSNSCADVENTEQPIHGTVSPYNVPVTQNTMASPSYHTALSEEPNVPYSFVSEDDYMDANLNLRDDQSETTLMSSTTLPKTSRSATDNVETYGDVPELKSDTTIRPVRWSSSDPSVSKTSVNTDLYIEESKPELNYAFLGGKTCNEDAIKNSRPVHMLPPTFLEEKRFTSASSPNEISQHSRESSIISLNSVTTYLTQLGWESMLQKIQHTSTNVIPITINDLTKLLREIMQEARNLTQAERCSVFLIDQETDELVAKVFDGITTNDNETKLVVSNQGLVHYPPSVQSEIRMPITQGIAGHVATTGNLLNIKDAYSHPMFYRGIDDSTGFRTRNILCFPIKNEIGVVLGVAQLCNKKTGPFFTTFDEDVASAFAVYCCISISHSLMYQRVIAAQIRNSLANELMMYHMKCLMYKKLQDSQHRNRLANELMIYHMQTLGSGSETALHTIYTHCRPISDYIVRTTHMLRESTGKDLMLDHLCNQTGAKYILIGCTEMAQVAQEDVDKLVHCNIPSVSDWHQNFDRFHFPPRQILEDDTSETCLTMFEDLGFIQKFRIRRDTLARFVLMVRRGYRNPPYHNWMHAFSVAHFCYVCVKNLDLQKHLDETELFALFVSCLCHDIDHRGTNNSYQVASKSVLAALYSSEGSVLERHHFAQTMCIVNTEGCNIFENLSSKDYQQVLDLVRDIILATDLAHHLRILKNIETMAKDGYQKSKLKNHKLLLCLLMTASDLSDQTKPWNYAKHIAALIYDEFFSQGDLEKSLGKEPMEMMDRERARIPDLQIGFLDHIALPVYKVLAQIFDAAKPVENAVEDNRRHWEKICGLIKLRRGGSCEQMSYDQILALEEEEEDKRSEISNHIQSQQNGKS